MDLEQILLAMGQIFRDYATKGYQNYDELLLQLSELGYSAEWCGDHYEAFPMGEAVAYNEAIRRRRLVHERLQRMRARKA